VLKKAADALVTTELGR
jgi:hypothetical protein